MNIALSLSNSEVGSELSFDPIVVKQTVQGIHYYEVRVVFSQEARKNTVQKKEKNNNMKNRIQNWYLFAAFDTISCPSYRRPDVTDQTAARNNMVYTHCTIY